MPVQVSQNNSFPPKIASNLWFSDNLGDGGGGGGRGKQQPTVALETNQHHRKNSETSVSCLENTALLFDCFSLKAKFGIISTELLSLCPIPLEQIAHSLCDGYSPYFSS